MYLLCTALSNCAEQAGANRPTLAQAAESQSTRQGSPAKPPVVRPAAPADSATEETSRAAARDAEATPHPERSWNDEGCAPGQALTERERSVLEGYASSPLSVVRIRPDDQLSLRSAPNVHASVVVRLPFGLGGLRPTGFACHVNGALWLEVETGRARGWVNERFAKPTSVFQALDNLGGTPLDQLTAPNLEQLSRLLRRVLSSYSGVGPSGRVEVIGRYQQQDAAQIVLFDGHGGDDSLSGQEYLAWVVFAAQRWRVQRLQQRATCWRGVSDDGECW